MQFVVPHSFRFAVLCLLLLTVFTGPPSVIPLQARIEFALPAQEQSASSPPITLSGILTDDSDQHVASLTGWLAVSPVRSPHGQPTHPASAPTGTTIMGGRFSIPLPPGSYQLALQLPFDSQYSPTAEPTIVTLQSQPKEIRIPLEYRSAQLGGMVLSQSSNPPIQRIEGEVVGWSGAELSMAVIDANSGAFSLAATPGIWALTYGLSATSQHVALPQLLSTRAGDLHTATLPVPLAVASRDSRLRGSLRSPQGAAVPHQPIQVRSADAGRFGLWLHATTDEAGQFELMVPEGKFWVSTPVTERGWVQPPSYLAAAISEQTTTLPPMQFMDATRILTGTLTLQLEDAYFASAFAQADSVKLNQVTPVHGQVQAWSDAGGYVRQPITFTIQTFSLMSTVDGQPVSVTVPAQGSAKARYEIGITGNAAWTIQAKAQSSIQAWHSDAQLAPGFAQNRLNITLEHHVDVPAPQAVTFEPEHPVQVRLSNGVSAFIPAEAIESASQVTIQLGPNLQSPSQHHVSAMTTSYRLTLVDANNESRFMEVQEPILVRMPFTEEAQRIATNDSPLRAAVYDQQSNLWRLLDHYHIVYEPGMDHGVASFLIESSHLQANHVDFALVSLNAHDVEGHPVISSDSSRPTEALLPTRDGHLVQLYLPTVLGDSKRPTAAAEAIFAIHVPVLYSAD